VVTEVDVLDFLEVKEGDPVLQVTDLVADRNAVSDGENAIFQRFVKDGDFFEHFGLSHFILLFFNYFSEDEEFFSFG
jgi:hypothetical protein